MYHHTEVRLSRVLCTSIGTEPPSEFRIFPAGKFSTTKGEFVFDAAAAASVMSCYQQQGTDVMLDLEHLALGDLRREDAADARAWFKLELRGGELWATQVRWTPDGARRLKNRTQRYISPAFTADESGRVLELFNVALVAMPATHGAEPLVAARKSTTCASTRIKHNGGRRPQKVTRLNAMNPDDVKAALDALEAGDSAKALELLKAMIASAASGGAAPSSDAGTEATSDTAEVEDPAEEMAALRHQVATLTKTLTAENAKLRSEVQALTSARDGAELIERRSLVAELVKCGAETPATAWDGKPEDRKPATHLSAMPIEKLRTRVKTFSARGPRAPLSPPSGSEEVEWTDAEKRQLAHMTPEQQAKFKEIRASRRK